MERTVNLPPRFGSESIASAVHFLAGRAHRWATRGLFAALAFLAQPTHAAVTEAWVQRYHGPSDIECASAVAVDGNGDVVITGTAPNPAGITYYYTAKCAAADGALLWEKRSYWPGTANALAVEGSGNVVVTGYSVGSNSYYDFYTAKYAAADGTLLWEKRYDGPANGLDTAHAVAVDGSGNVVVTGYSYNTNFHADFYTAKYAASDGALLWEKRYNGSANMYALLQVAVDGSGEVIMTGASDNGTNAGSYTAKYAAADGALLWEHHGPAGGAAAMAVDVNGNVVVTGYSDNGTNADYYTAKYAAADGALLWEKRYNGPANRDDFPNALAVDASGNVVVTGRSNNGTNDDYYTAKYAAANGALLWERRYDGPGVDFNYDEAVAVAVDSSGNVVVTGTSYSGNIFLLSDYYTAKYAAADGALLWEERYNGPANGGDFFYGSHNLALGLNGMVIVTGYSAGTNGFDFATVVYRETLPAVSMARVPTGVSLRFPGVAGKSYQVLRAPTVTGPWTTNTTSITFTNGIIEYIDTTAPPGSAFYRTAVAP